MIKCTSQELVWAGFKQPRCLSLAISPIKKVEKWGKQAGRSGEIRNEWVERLGTSSTIEMILTRHFVSIRFISTLLWESRPKRLNRFEISHDLDSHLLSWISEFVTLKWYMWNKFTTVLDLQVLTEIADSDLEISSSCIRFKRFHFSMPPRLNIS